ncbi:C-terminal binding protein [Halegenticoccus tardaugens]|uniref:C-terminal binding protein n=1 Tax=Halegenticoccus tardaugens TaxID=2071624 RepID=UPI00100AD33D
MIDAAHHRRVLEPIGATVETAEMGSTDALVSAADGADAIVTDVTTAVPPEAIERLDSLSVIGRAGDGIDNVDVVAAAERGVTVVRVPDYCTDEVANHAVSLLLSAVRSVPQYDRDTREGGWTWEVGGPIHELPGTTVGVVSFGPIARRFVELLSGFDATILAHDPYVDAAEIADHGAEKVGFEELLERADCVSVHAPLTDGTRDMFDREAFDAMTEGTILVNTGRGGVVDEAALAAALDDGIVRTAALDVLDAEPPDDSPLLGREDVIVTPHAGWYSEEARDRLNESIATDVRRALGGETPEGAVDPDVEWL